MADMKNLKVDQLDKVVGGVGEEMKTINNTGDVAYANIRKEPSLNAEVLFTLDNGAEIETTGQTIINDGITWVEVYLGGTYQYGWVASNLLI